jgi:hypothetical protein
MLCVVTSIRDSIALAATCCELNVSTPKEQSFLLDAKHVSSWVLRLPGLLYPVVFDLSTGLVTYHRLDNAFDRYAHLMRFLYAFYAVQGRLRHAGGHVLCKDNHSVPVEEAV